MSLQKHGITLRESVLQRAREMDGILLGPQSHASYPPPEQGGRNISAAFRVGLDLYANIRPARTYTGVRTHMPADRAMDMVIVREATEGFYPDRNMHRGWAELMPTEDLALSFRRITRRCCERIAARAFDIARTRNRHVTAVHKANSFHLTDGLFLECVRRVHAQHYPDIQLDDLLVDAAAAHIVRAPHSLDVIVTTNLYGDILSDLASELCGSLGLGGAVMHSDSHCAAQAQHGSAPTIAGQDIANPSSMILSAAMLLQWMARTHKDERLSKSATRIEHAIQTVLAQPSLHTRDLGGSSTCSAFSAAIEHNI